MKHHKSLQTNPQVFYLAGRLLRFGVGTLTSSGACRTLIDTGGSGVEPVWLNGLWLLACSDELEFAPRLGNMDGLGIWNLAHLTKEAFYYTNRWEKWVFLGNASRNPSLNTVHICQKGFSRETKCQFKLWEVKEYGSTSFLPTQASASKTLCGYATYAAY